MAERKSESKEIYPMLSKGEGEDGSSEKQGDRGRWAGKVGVFVKQNLLLILVLVGVLAGFGLGFGLRSFRLSEVAVTWLGLPGEVFIRSLTCVIVPLLISCIISGTASLDPSSNGKVSSFAIAYVIVFNAAGNLFGLAMFYIMNPANNSGDNAGVSVETGDRVKLETSDLFVDLILNIFPDNIITACSHKDQTVYVEKEVKSSTNPNETVTSYVRTPSKVAGTNMLGIIVFCTIIGITAGKVGEASKPFCDFFKASSHVIMSLMHWLVWLTPLGVLSLIATAIAKTDDIESTMSRFGLFTLTVIVTMAAIHGLILILYFIVFQMNPFRYLYHSLRPVLAGFAPPATVLAVPELLHTLENKHQVDPVIARFCVLFFSQTCRIGSGAFVIICTLFLASIEGVTLSAGQVVSVLLLTTASCLAVPSVPSGSVVLVLIVLSSVSVYNTQIGIVLALEWLLDRVRTTTNVQSTLFGTLVINKMVSRNPILFIEDDANGNLL